MAMYGSELAAPAQRLLTRCLRLKAGERFAVVADSRQDPQLVDAFVGAARALDIDTTCVVYTTRHDQVEPPDAVAAAMASADAYALIPTRSITYTDAHARAKAAGARALICSGMTLHTILDVVPNIDYDEVQSLGKRLMDALNDTRVVRVESPDGTNLRIDVEGRSHFVHDGILDGPGEEDDVPGGGAYVTPQETETEGTWVFNASLVPPLGIIETPVKVQVSHGKINSVSGGREAKLFEAWLASFDDPNMYYISEFGLGFNRACTLTGTTPGEDENVYGMVHVGVGRNYLAFPGGNIRAKSHTDGQLSGANVWFDDVPVLSGGTSYLI